ncbi:sodium-coupled neutral amino acid transporter 9-like [Gigantopelta aegis]|uniref:sodium-coupled neutral amino acid transporter 9-like n=1 Tax=Gigantopelta aegis TaxID=1735272 RepID=UPI001B8897E2|nr:sodium-coupled neutral amino acid transporter 9-like [Gigantopelta aegis]
MNKSSVRDKGRKTSKQKSQPKGTKDFDPVESETKIRRPIHHYSINETVSTSDSYNDDSDHETRALLHRYKYYSRLTPHTNGILQMPDHIVPSNYLITILVPLNGKQNSVITIFALWNTMMGTSLLSMPWAIKQAGFACGICMLIGMAGLMLYTSYRILKSLDGIEMGEGQVLEFSDVCRHYFGKWSELVAVVCSLLTLLGGAIVYWILMSNFLFHVVSFLYYQVHPAPHSTPFGNSSNFSDAVCPHMVKPDNATSSHSTFSKVWDEQMTVPFFLVLMLLPLLNFKSPTFFTKFNALGTISVAYLVSFVSVKASNWGINLDFNTEDINLPSYTSQFDMTFPALTGIAALAYFVQNCVLSICRNQKHPENNVRDLSIAYILVASTYIFVGVLFYSAFPLTKVCIQDNLLNNIATTDVMAFVARIGLFFQMSTVFPLLMYVFRVQFMHTLFGSVWPSWKHVLLLNLVLIGICILFAVFLPHIGKIIGFVGAFCGLAYAIALPCMVYLKSCYLEGTLSWPKIVIHSFLIVIGIANFIGQFLILGHTT